MSPRSEFFAALTAMSGDQHFLAMISALLCLTVFLAATLRAAIMRQATSDRAAALPLELSVSTEQRPSHQTQDSGEKHRGGHP